MRGDNVLHAGGEISLGMRGDNVLHAGGEISLGMGHYSSFSVTDLSGCMYTVLLGVVAGNAIVHVR